MLFILRLQRLYASMRLTKHMRWYYENRQEERVLYHLANREAWKHVDITHPNFAHGPWNVHLNLCLDGFSHYNHSIAPYFC